MSSSEPRPTSPVQPDGDCTPMRKNETTTASGAAVAQVPQPVPTQRATVLSPLRGAFALASKANREVFLKSSYEDGLLSNGELGATLGLLVSGYILVAIPHILVPWLGVSFPLEERWGALYALSMQWTAVMLLLTTHGATTRARARSRQEVTRRAKRVSRLVTVTAGMEFCPRMCQDAFQRWPGYGALDWWPLLVGLVGHLGVMAEMVQRPQVCSHTTATRYASVAAAAVCAVRLVVWWRLRPAQRSWLNLASSACAIGSMVWLLYRNDTCLPSLLRGVAGTSLPGRLAVQMVMTTCTLAVFPVTVRHTRWQALLACAGVFWHMASPVCTLGPGMQSAEAQLRVAAMAVWAVLLWMLALTARVAVAERTMLRFLRSLQRDLGMGDHSVATAPRRHDPKPQYAEK
eukprot:jgi/Tetstr1/449043/TSEL_036259.t1